MSKGPGHTGGAEGTRTPDPHTASVVRYQLRHSPVVLGALYRNSGGARRGAEQGSEAGVVTFQTPAALGLDER
jgi:integrase